jgi:uncharacterized protein YbaR (Trm112 family)
MFIELVDALRCPNEHEESWLVLAATTLEDRHIRDGVLGCPVCLAEYSIRDGIADFRRERETTTRDTYNDERPRQGAASMVSTEQLAAMLSLPDALGFAVLTGEWCRHADALDALIDAPPLLLVDPPAQVTMRPGISGLMADERLPLAVRAARAVAVDEMSMRRVESAAECTRVGGHVVAPVDASVPSSVRELARDGAVWVGAREASTSGLVSLHVRRGL